MHKAPACETSGALDSTSAIAYVRAHPALSGIFGREEPLTCSEIGDGNINLIFVVRSVNDPARSVLIKQALPYIRRYPQHQLTDRRALYEVGYYQEAMQLCAERVPRVFAYDEDRALLAMENLDHHVILRKSLVERRNWPHLAEHMGHFLAAMLYGTSDFHVDAAEKKEKVRRFINPELCRVTERAIFTGPYTASYELNKWNRLLDPVVSAIRDDQGLKANVMELKYGFMTRSESLIHGDLHTGSVMVNEDDTRVIDPEFCFFGPMGFDLGLLFGNYILNYAAQQVSIVDAPEQEAYQGYLLGLVRETWRVFQGEFETTWLPERTETVPVAYCRDFMQRLLQDSAGYAGCEIIRRLIGSAPVEDMESIAELKQQARATALGLHIGQRLVLERTSMRTIEDLLTLVRTTQSFFPTRSTRN